MVLWRLSGRQHAAAFDGGYGLLFNGRWNTVGYAVTYCATSPSLCVLEKLVHVEDPMLLPDLVMVSYQAPDGLAAETIALADMTQDWRRQKGWTQQRGNHWHQAQITPMLRVPSAIVPLVDSPDVNVVINHTHPACAAIAVRALEPFVFDPRLL